MGKREVAMGNHAKGYNCAQAVMCAFAYDLGLDGDQLFDAVEGFGLGGGTMEGACGALASAILVAGVANGGHPLTKDESFIPTRRLATEIQKRFKERAGAVVCKEIKGIDTGKVLCPCRECVGIAAEIAEDVLGLK